MPNEILDADAYDLKEAAHRNQVYIDGTWVETGRDVISIENPASQGIMGKAPNTAGELVDKAVRAARAALPDWSSRDVRDRSQLLRAVAAAVERRTKPLTELLVREVGVPRTQIQPMQIAMAVDALRHAADIAESMAWESRVGTSLVVAAPLGLVACVLPWNVPLYQGALKVGAAMVAGNTVVVKPSELAPLSLFMLADAMAEVGVPPGVFNLISGDQCVGANLVSHDLVNKISFTGSTETGKSILRRAAENITPASVELGGKGAALILDRQALGSGVRAALRSCFSLAGQTCVATTRLIVLEEHRREVEELAEAELATYVVGDPNNESTMIGPVISDRQRQRVQSYIQDALDEHAVLVPTERIDLPPRGYYVAPAVFTQVDPDAKIAQEEIFGPVLCIISAPTREEIVRIANATPYGLSHAVWSEDQDEARRIAQDLNAGSVYINGGKFNPHAPFGGVGASGYGRERGRAGIEGFTQARSFHLPVT